MLDLRRDILPYLTGFSPGVNGAPPAPPASKYLHAYYDEAKKRRDHLDVVFGESYPDYLNINRPREKKDHKDYRKKIYLNPFRSFRPRIASVLDYIRQADDFDVQFPSDPTPDSLRAYCGPDLTADGDLTTWFFRHTIPAYVGDPNAVLCALPWPPPPDDRTRPAPRPFLIPCEGVWAYRRGQFAVLVAPERVDIETPDGLQPDGLVLFFLDHDSYAVARQQTRRLDPSGKPLADWLLSGLDPLPPDQIASVAADGLSAFRFRPARHYAGTLPARKLGLRRVQQNGRREELYESFLADALPSIKLAQQNLSDIQIETHFHVASQEWRRTTGRCKNPDCNDGRIPERDPSGAITGEKVCPSCLGTSFDLSGSGMDIFWVAGGETEGFSNPNGTRPLPGAPGGFIPRDIAPLKKFTEELRRNSDEAYASINMQFIRQTPLEQSGLAKRYDREELYRELNTQAAHLLDLLTWHFRIIDLQRYGPTGEAGPGLPQVLIPIRFNLENAELTREELNNAKDKRYDSTLVEAYEKKMLLYTTGENSDEYRRYVLRITCDPFKDMTDEMKSFLLGLRFRNPTTPENTAAIERLYFSVHFDGLVADALREDPDFWQQPAAAQYQELLRRNLLLVGPQLTGPLAPGMADGGAGTGGAFPAPTPLRVPTPVDIQQPTQDLLRSR